MYLSIMSNNSISHFPENTPSEFAVKLPREIFMNGKWRVGLAKIEYPHTWWNVPNSLNHWISIRRRKKFTYILLPRGHYRSIESIIQHLNYAAHKKLKLNIVHFTYNSFSRLVQLEVASKVTLKIGRGLRVLFGFKRNVFHRGLHIAKRSVDIHSSYLSLYVYCNLISPRIVGENMSQLLSIIPVHGVDGQQIHQRFENVQYFPLNVRTFETIRISIRDDQGNHIPFDRGYVLVTLHFKSCI